MQKLIDLIYTPFDGEWESAVRQAFESLFDGGRYGKRAGEKVHIRINAGGKATNVPFAALISPDQPDAGPYGGMSFVIFPGEEDAPSLASLVVGTNGLQPDEVILSRPGHARKCAAISRWLNHRSRRLAVWAKRDPSRIDLPLPQAVQRAIQREDGQFGRTIDRYGHVIYLLYMPQKERDSKETEVALRSFLDLFMAERGHLPLKGHQASFADDQSRWIEHVLPDCDEGHLAGLLKMRRYVILEGPPGTGKTRMARRLLANTYQGHGMSIQFHPSTTYEDFIGGLAPVSARGDAGLQFAPKAGSLMEAVRHCLEHPDRPFLLHVDEINRADLSKVLGEAVFLFEVDEPDRVVQLAHDFGADFRKGLRIPPNLHLLGTMNSADRSIAILDLAIRRRFAFVRLWPQADVVKRHGGSLAQEAFQELFRIFLEYAPDEAFDLMPGHGYFLVSDDQAKDVLSTGVAPLLQEYLKQGYVAGFEDEIRAYLDWLDAR